MNDGFAPPSPSLEGFNDGFATWSGSPVRVNDGFAPPPPSLEGLNDGFATCSGSPVGVELFCVITRDYEFIVLKPPPAKRWVEDPCSAAKGKWGQGGEVPGACGGGWVLLNSYTSVIANFLSLRGTKQSKLLIIKSYERYKNTFLLIIVIPRFPTLLFCKQYRLLTNLYTECHKRSSQSQSTDN